MKALVKYALEADRVEVRDIPDPRAGAGRVLLRVQAAGVCGSDLHMWHNTHSWAITLPLVLGHEFSAVVEEVGAGVDGFAPGDRVTCETAASVCGRCAYCVSGHYNLCPERKGYGALIDGVFSEFVVARPAILHHLPENVSFEQAALTEPICVAYNALVEKSEIRPGDTVVIQGPGPIGMLALLIALARGASPVIMLGTGVDRRRLAKARELGAHHAIDIQAQDPAELLRGIDDGLGAHLVVDCTGVSAALQQSMDLVRPNGQITKIGWGPQPLGVSLDPLVAKAATLQGCFSHTHGTWERVLKLMAAQQLNLGAVVGGVYPLDAWREAFADMGSGANVKSVLLLDA
jgi:L-iditol 2-dehydrogenase